MTIIATINRTNTSADGSQHKTNTEEENPRRWDENLMAKPQKLQLHNCAANTYVDEKAVN